MKNEKMIELMGCQKNKCKYFLGKNNSGTFCSATLTLKQCVYNTKKKEEEKWKKQKC
jgi:hypothetical protein